MIDAEALPRRPAVGPGADDEPGVEPLVDEPGGRAQVLRGNGRHDRAGLVKPEAVDKSSVEMRSQSGEQRGGLRHTPTPFYRQSSHRMTHDSARPIRFHAG